MPALKPSDRELMNREVRAVLRATQERKGLKSQNMAKSVMIPYSTYQKRLKEPEKLSLEDFRMIVRFCKPTDEEILRMVRANG